MKRLFAVFSVLVCLTYVGCGNHHRHRGRLSDAVDAINLTIGIPVSGFVDEAGDTDTYTVELEAGSTYRIYTLNLSADMDTVLRLFGIDGSLIGENDNVSGSDLSSLLEIAITESGVYTIIVSHHDLAAFSGMYDLIVELVDTGDGGDGGDDGCPQGPPPGHDCRNHD